MEQFPTKKEESKNEPENTLEKQEKMQTGRLKTWLRKVGLYTAIVAGSYFGSVQESSGQTVSNNPKLDLGYKHFDLDSAGVQGVSSLKEFKHQLLKSEYFKTYVEQEKVKALDYLEERIKEQEKTISADEQVIRKYENNFELFKTSFIEIDLKDKYIYRLVKQSLPVLTDCSTEKLKQRDPLELYTILMSGFKVRIEMDKDQLDAIKDMQQKVKNEMKSKSYVEEKIERIWKYRHSDIK